MIDIVQGYSRTFVRKFGHKRLAFPEPEAVRVEVVRENYSGYLNFNI
jgi:hypothetical protein